MQWDIHPLAASHSLMRACLAGTAVNMLSNLFGPGG